ncbi:unnamed protein product, partial [marine sediment metagenome]
EKINIVTILTALLNPSNLKTLYRANNIIKKEINWTIKVILSEFVNIIIHNKAISALKGFKF